MSRSDRPAGCGWESTFDEFEREQPRVIRGRLQEFLPDADVSQVRAWDDSIPKLQTEVREVVASDPAASTHTAVLEYELPLDSRRPDVVLLVQGAVVVLELKGEVAPSQADIDQAAAYARDLRCYHRACAGREVHAIVTPTRARGYVGVRSGVHVAGPDALDGLVQKLQAPWPSDAVSAGAFLAEDAYCPLPTLVQAARELFDSGTVRRVHRAAAATDPAAEEVSRIVHQAAQTRTRRLVLVTGVPGAGKTLVGLRAVHAHFLDDLAVDRADGKPTAPAVFLSGNGPLVEVLQYELRSAGGGGKTFVRSVRDYVRQYSRKRSLVPPEHVLVFDEAQRAWDAQHLARKHKREPDKSEPEHFVEFAMRIPEWCTVIGLIGGGQEIHAGEEGGLVQWRHAIERCDHPAHWTVHGPESAAAVFADSPAAFEANPALNLDTEIRYHLASDVHEFVRTLLEDGDTACCRELATALESAGFHLRMTRDLEVARNYLRDRYREHPTARFGLLASSRDKDLAAFGVPNDFQSTKVIRHGPWYSDGEESPQSCRHLTDAITEFGAQGLELDAVLLAWGTDFRRYGGQWDDSKARRYRDPVQSPFQLRLNSYRVLLTRGRDAVVVFVPEIDEMQETAEYLCSSGFEILSK